MRLGTLRVELGTVAVRIHSDTAIEITDVPDVGTLLNLDDWRLRAEQAAGTVHEIADLPLERWAPVVPRPGKVVCVGLNYRNHILEMGRELPEFPTLFSKYPEALIGPGDPIVLPASALNALDWEGELAVIIGSRVRRADKGAAVASIAGYAVLNDVTMRDWQYRTPEWLQGKSFEASTPFGPYLVTPDEFSLGAQLRTTADGDVVQMSSTDDLVFEPSALIEYITQIFPLNAGDVIATGTPGGVGHARKPPRYLTNGSILETEIDGLGAQRNAVIGESR